MSKAVQVTVNRSQVIATSRLQIGVTHTQYSLDTGGDPGAIVRGKRCLSDAGCRLQNVHLMGWGTLNPNPAPGLYDWSTLDRRLDMIRSQPGAVPVLTLCGCPDWMKGSKPGATDWSKLETAPQQYPDFARLAATVAKRYPDVRYFQVWNEMKGLWNPSENNWDYRNYTALYNAVYDALKCVNSRVQVGVPTSLSKAPAATSPVPPLPTPR